MSDKSIITLQKTKFRTRTDRGRGSVRLRVPERSTVIRLGLSDKNSRTSRTDLLYMKHNPVKT